MKGPIKILGGTARGRYLVSPRGKVTRPALARMRKSLFDTLQNHLPGAKVLDLFAGTGSLGLEALSRGAEFCLFVENDRKVWRILKANITNLGFDKQSEVILTDGLKMMPCFKREQYHFDIVFLAPPYRFFQDAGLTRRLLELLEEMVVSQILQPDGVVIIEHRKDQLADLSLRNFARYDQRSYGQTCLSFLEPLTKRTGSTDKQ